MVYKALLFLYLKADDGIRCLVVTGVQTCALPICGTTSVAYGAMKTKSQARPTKQNVTTPLTDGHVDIAV